MAGGEVLSKFIPRSCASRAFVSTTAVFTVAFWSGHVRREVFIRAATKTMRANCSKLKAPMESSVFLLWLVYARSALYTLWRLKTFHNCIEYYIFFVPSSLRSIVFFDSIWMHLAWSLHRTIGYPLFFIEIEWSHWADKVNFRVCCVLMALPLLLGPRPIEIVCSACDRDPCSLCLMHHWPHNKRTIGWQAQCLAAWMQRIE